jgi:oligopeptide/dipeptide ABC transporter ATP-binding protein
VKQALLEVKNLVKYYPVRKGLFGKGDPVKAVDGVSLTVFKGETLSIVGESGCGKSTVGRCLLRLVEPTAGQVLFEGEDLLRMNAARLREIRKDLQIIFQNPYASLNPRRTVRQILMEPLVVHGIGDAAERKERVERMMVKVGLSASQLDRYPHEFSGGQRQRICIARALMLNPKLIVADEPVSALDVSIQAQILNLLKDLQQEFGLSYVFISHDLSVVKHVSDRVAVMYLGKIVEIADKNILFNNPRHPYTRVLLSSIPVPDPDVKRERVMLEGEPPNPARPPAGCAFHPRCRMCIEECKTKTPTLAEIEEGHHVSCLLAGKG